MEAIISENQTCELTLIFKNILNECIMYLNKHKQPIMSHCFLAVIFISTWYFIIYLGYVRQL